MMKALARKIDNEFEKEYEELNEGAVALTENNR